MTNIILASASPRRKKLLQQINLSFTVHPSSVDESYDPALSPGEIVTELALRKARDVAPQYSNALIIGADTIVTFNKQILEKPKDPQEAQEMLHQLSDNVHQVLTGVALCKVDSSNNISNSLTFVERTNVKFGNLNSDDIKKYARGGSPLDKAGGYGIQDDFGAVFVKRIEGDYYNVVGFPLHSFYNALHSFAPEILPQIGSAE